jgi:hypothetical protein
MMCDAPRLDESSYKCEYAATGAPIHQAGTHGYGTSQSKTGAWHAWYSDFQDLWQIDCVWYSSPLTSLCYLSVTDVSRQHY